MASVNLNDNETVTNSGMSSLSYSHDNEFLNRMTSDVIWEELQTQISNISNINTTDYLSMLEMRKEIIANQVKNSGDQQLINDFRTAESDFYKKVATAIVTSFGIVPVEDDIFDDCSLVGTASVRDFTKGLYRMLYISRPARIISIIRDYISTNYKAIAAEKGSLTDRKDLDVFVNRKRVNTLEEALIISSLNSIVANFISATPDELAFDPLATIIGEDDSDYEYNLVYRVLDKYVGNEFLQTFLKVSEESRDFNFTLESELKVHFLEKFAPKEQ